jgi:hypothetical protein
VLEVGKRVGGRVVPVKEWLDLLRDEWNIPKVELSKTTDTQKVEQEATDGQP